jgi:hypothetical protein
VRVVISILALAAAAAAAILLGVVAHNELGIPSDTIRNDALTSAGFISIVLVWGSILRR